MFIANMMYPYGGGIDPWMIAVLVAFGLSLLASFYVKFAFNKNKKVQGSRGITGAQAAQRILSSMGLQDVRIEKAHGSGLSDHYDPRSRVLRLSEEVYGSTSVAALGVAAHECGHAVQHHKQYFPLTFRNAMVTPVNIAASLAMPIFTLGFLFFQSNLMLLIGIILFSFSVAFHLITLPVEFDASFRALSLLDQTEVLTRREQGPAKQVLFAAALTYVASAIVVLMQLLRLIALSGGRSSRRR
ncbi:peptidase [Clostridia bacterium]|nr:peptidase [Clostridia bacterium]